MRASKKQSARRGSILLLVLVVVAMLTLGTATYLELMQNERLAVRHHGRGVQAARLAESGVEYVQALLALTPDELQRQGGVANNPTAMQAIVVDDKGDQFERGRFSIVSPAQVDGQYSGYRFGLQDESAKLNLNALLAPGAEGEGASRLLALPGMTPEIADAILDWLDADSSPRPNGAEAEAYSQLAPAYPPRNGPIANLDELLLVRGVTPELLYGVDQNRNLLVDASERPRGLLTELDNADGELNLGWSAYLTTTGVESLQPEPDLTGADSTAAALVDLNSQDLQQLYNDLQATIGDDKAKFLIAYRQYGSFQEGTSRGAGRAGTAGRANVTGRPGGRNATQLQNIQGIQDAGGLNDARNRNGQPGRPPGESAGGASQPPPVEIDAAAIHLKFDQPGGTIIRSPLDLVGTRVQLPGENDAPAQNVSSPWADDAASYRELLDLYDVAAPVSGARLAAGRVNVNAASRAVLNSIPSLPPTAVGRIVGRREAEPDPTQSDQRHAIWLLIEGIVTLDEMRRLERYVTVGGDVFSGQVVGFFDAGPAAARYEFIVDRSGKSPRLRAWRDLTPLGRGFSATMLGVELGESSY